MDRSVLEASVEEAERYAADPTPVVSSTVRARRRLRATELAEVHAAVESGDWYRSGFRSPTDWLASTTNESIGVCRVTLRLADRIRRMSHVESAFAEGALAESALRLLTDAWDPAIADVFARDEELLLRWAIELPHRDFKLVLGTWRMHADPDREERSAAERFDRRSLHLSGLLDDMGRLDGLLDPEGFALVREAIRALATPATDDTRTAAQRRADALVGMARITLGSLEPEPGRRRNRPKVIATIALDDLVAGSRGGSLDTHLDRTVVPAHTIRRLACDCGLHRYVTNPLGTVVDFGRQQRTVTDPQFDRLVVRDHGCRWPGCHHPAAGCDAHHADHWLDGGETEDDNLVLLCWFHHHLLHEQHWSIEPLGAGHFHLLDPAGRSQPMRPPLVGLALPLFPPSDRSATLPG
jgi:hypothetical protein